jgi:GalNAc-alpha-(1->4)-GalNAc-alpha-(1->3)-diNAcBac-PP-undecaprenol alpha-1,4-N-acetyl-D-galactosaminyltransferase
MAAYWSNAGHEVHVVALRADEHGPAYAVPPTVRIHRMNLIHEHNPVWDPRHFGRLWRLRRLLKSLRPTLVLSFIDKLNVAVLLSLAGTGIPVVATEHLVPWKNKLGLVWEKLRAAAYPRAWAVISPTLGMTDWFKEHYDGKYLTLPYPAHHDLSNGEQEDRSQIIFSAGRLAHEKGYDLLLSAFAGVSEKRSGWRLEIAGEGPERGVLTEQIKEFGLESRVFMPGHVSDVAARMRSAELFVLSSRQEAYPMVLCEAMAAGLAIIASDCPTGPVAIIENGENGILVPPEDAAALGLAMIRLIDDTPERRRLGAAARVKAPRLATAHVMLEWDQLLSEADTGRA